VQRRGMGGLSADTDPSSLPAWKMTRRPHADRLEQRSEGCLNSAYFWDVLGVCVWTVQGASSSFISNSRCTKAVRVLGRLTRMKKVVQAPPNVRVGVLVDWHREGLLWRPLLMKAGSGMKARGACRAGWMSRRCFLAGAHLLTCVSEGVSVCESERGRGRELAGGFG
jgi:hypothetical protein